MIRDRLKTEQYFEGYIACEKDRAAKFAKKMPLLKTPEQRKKCNGYLASFEKNILTAEYSVGAPKPRIAEAFDRYLSALAGCGVRSYAEMVDALSLDILLDRGGEGTQVLYEDKAYDDALVLALKAYLQKGMLEISGSGLRFAEHYGAFWEFLVGDEEDAAERLIWYVGNDWYPSCREMSWYDSHASRENTYCGYWCWLAAALLKLKDRSFQRDEFRYIPTELI